MARVSAPQLDQFASTVLGEPKISRLSMKVSTVTSSSRMSGRDFSTQQPAELAEDLVHVAEEMAVAALRAVNARARFLVGRRDEHRAAHAPFLDCRQGAALSLTASRDTPPVIGDAIDRDELARHHAPALAAGNFHRGESADEDGITIGGPLFLIGLRQPAESEPGLNVP